MPALRPGQPYESTVHLTHNDRQRWTTREIEVILRQQGRPHVSIPKYTRKCGLIQLWEMQDDMLNSALQDGEEGDGGDEVSAESDLEGYFGDDDGDDGEDDGDVGGEDAGDGEEDDGEEDDGEEDDGEEDEEGDKSPNNSHSTSDHHYITIPDYPDEDTIAAILTDAICELSPPSDVPREITIFYVDDIRYQVPSLTQIVVDLLTWRLPCYLCKTLDEFETVWREEVEGRLRVGSVEFQREMRERYGVFDEAPFGMEDREIPNTEDEGEEEVEEVEEEEKGEEEGRDEEGEDEGDEGDERT